MPPSQISAYSAFYQPGTTKVYVVTTCANYLSPTRAELDAGLDITRQVRAIDGFTVAADQLDRQDYATTFTAKVGGRQQAADSSLTVYAAATGSDIRTTLPFGYVGYIVFLDGGDTAGRKMDVYPVQVISAPKQRGDSDPFTLMIQFSITQVPAENVTIPA